MYVVCVEVVVKPEFVDAFIAASRLNHEGTRRDEPGNVRWDLVQKEDDPTRFLLYEVYRTRAGFAHHQQTAHYLRWRDEVAAMMQEPRRASRYASVAPADADWNG
jgi:autoinducer 2-degrading protein